MTILLILQITILILTIILDVLTYKYFKKQDVQDPIQKGAKREHARLSKTTYSNPLNPYDIYKDKETNLYEPRKQGGGVKIEVDK